MSIPYSICKISLFSLITSSLICSIAYLFILGKLILWLLASLIILLFWLSISSSIFSEIYIGKLNLSSSEPWKSAIIPVITKESMIVYLDTNSLYHTLLTLLTHTINVRK